MGNKYVIGQPFLVYKKCYICGEQKEVRSEYYRDASKKDGRTHACKKCHDVFRKRHVEKYPERTKARRLARGAVRKGTLKKEPCASCGSIENIHGHHDDYSKPLEVR